MTTSVFIGSSSSPDLDNPRSKQMETSLMNGSGVEKPTWALTGKQSGGGRRKKVNESTQKKVRQRGMGVEQLERLRFQERIKKMKEIKPLIHSLPFPTTPAFGGYNIVNGGVGGGQVGSDVVHGRVHNHGPVVNSGVGNLFADHELKFLAMDSFGVGSGFRVTDQTSKELSSIPNNLKWNSECGVCFKKIHGNGENLTCNGERKFCGEMSGFGDFGSVENKGNMFNGVNPYYGSKPTGQEVEVMAVHRKGMNTGGGGGGGSVLMEYEFFPGKVGGNYCNYKELINMASSSSSFSYNHHHHHHHHQDFNHGGAGSHDPIDLSLKL